MSPSLSGLPNSLLIPGYLLPTTRGGTGRLPNMTSADITPLGWKGYFERFVTPILQRDRFFIAFVFAIVVAGIEGAALLTLIPLHTTVPYVIETDAQGRVVASGVVTHSVGEPTTASTTYWLGKWVSNLYLVDPAYTRANLQSDYFLTQGPAVGQFSRFIQGASSPVSLMQANPALRTSVVVKGVRSIGLHEAYVVVDVKNHLTGIVTEHGVTLTYQFAPPTNVQQALKNPLGLQITNFSMGGGV